MDLQWLGQRIRTAREQRGLSQEDLAALIGRDQRAVSQYETGKRKISVHDLPKFAEALEMPLSYFYEEAIPSDDLDQILLYEFHRLSSQEARQDAIEILRTIIGMLQREVVG